MTAMNTDTLHTEILSLVRGLSTDDQLALLWLIYKEMGSSVTPAAPGASTASPAVAEGLFGQVQQMSQDQQLQIQRDLVKQKNTQIGREYGALSPTTKLLFWYLLAQGMDAGSIIPYPEDYQPDPDVAKAMAQITKFSFSEQIHLLRQIVGPMGVDPSAVAHDINTGL